MLYELKNEEYTSRIDLSHGACCVSLKSLRYSVDILRERGSELPTSNPCLFGIPLLFPVNRIGDGKFIFEDTEYLFPVNELSTNCHIHGTLYSLPFEPVYIGKELLKAQFVSDEVHRYLSFPNNFKIEVTYSLEKNGLTLECEIFNLSDKNMPIMLGHHTTFSTEFADGHPYVYAEIDEEFERDPIRFLPTGKNISPDTVSVSLKKGEYKLCGTPLSRHYSASGGRMALVSKEKRLKVVYECSDEYRFRLLYSNGSDYICLEPQTCIVNAPNLSIPYEKSGFHFIKPKESKKYTTKIYITDNISYQH